MGTAPRQMSARAKPGGPCKMRASIRKAPGAARGCFARRISAPDKWSKAPRSCSSFDARGGLVANAPHMPVHLGSMGDCVTAIMKKHADMRDGDAFVTNAPYDGGTHLPDITIVTPVFVDGARRFFAAARGHHA